MEGSTAVAKQKVKLKGNKKEEREKSSKGKVAKGKGKDVVLNAGKYEGQGLIYKAKLFGFVEVPGPRGDDTCVNAIQKLKQQAKQLKKGANEHKLKITVNITLKGIRLYNDKTLALEHEHPIHKISFISHDPEDRHVFGYIFSPPRSSLNEARKYCLFAIKSEKLAEVITTQLYELFQVVYKMREHRKNTTKENMTSNQKQDNKSAKPLEPLQNKMLLEMSNKIGGEQKQNQEEHLYSEPTLPRESSETSHYDVPRAPGSHRATAVGNDEYQVSQPNEDGLSEKEREDIATAIALSLSMQEKSGLPEAETDTLSHENNSISESAFHAEFPPVENGFSSSYEFRSEQNDDSSYSMHTDIADLPDEELNPKTNNARGNVSSDFDLKLAVENSSETSPAENVSEEGIFKKTQEPNSTGKEITPNSKEYKPIDSTKDSDNNHGDIEKRKVSADSSVHVVYSSFEVNFDTENENVITAKQSEQDTFAFSSTSDVFSNEDPFASSSANEFNEAKFTSFSDDDPFSPRGGSASVEFKSDPFGGSSDAFANSFDDIATGGSAQIQPRHSAKESSLENDPSMFEEIKENAPQNVAYGNDSFDLDTIKSSEGEVEYVKVDHSLKNDFAMVNNSSVADLDNSDPPDNTASVKEQEETLDNIGKAHAVADETSSSDSSLNNSDVTANTAALKSILSSTTESSPPPLPPRPDVPPRELNEVVASSPKIPPALPPRPSINVPSPKVETSQRQPPELPPRIDLEDDAVLKDELSDGELEPSENEFSINTSEDDTENNFDKNIAEDETRIDFFDESFGESKLESFSPADNKSEVYSEQNTDISSKVDMSSTFDTNFDAFDFDNVDVNSASRSETTTPVFISDDPFKDPFAGTDPFQTPNTGDPFASSPLFDENTLKSGKDFDPFSGDDPFAMTPAFDKKASADVSIQKSRLNKKQSSSNDFGDDADQEKFADFSSSFR
ncbi:protein BNI1-like [Xenia sp. Carnegie-2017]|uniref:protein BNI1-like n=1 Tax=Xenia sp. Carnegie-2017 TaxID=2897299 RepID=UPI001F04A1E1|nr:protein BNI1-like [Xenia sp. Carnegie-2017]